MYLDHVCWALSFVTEKSGKSSERIQKLIESEILPVLVDQLTTPQESFPLYPALRIIGNIVSIDDSAADKALASGICPVIAKLLRHDEPSIVKEATWVVSNIAAGNRVQICALFIHDIIQSVVDLLIESEIKCRTEAAWVISNICNGKPTKQINFEM